MAKARDIKKRIHAVTQTRKITRTMEMVSTSKLRRCQKVVLSSRPYYKALTDVLGNLITSPETQAHPLMENRAEIRRVRLYVITSNRGLCGAFNINICRKALLLKDELGRRGVEVELDVAGKKGISFFTHRGFELVCRDTELTDMFTVDQTHTIFSRLSGEFLSGKVDQVHVACCRFISTGSQKVVTEQLFPLTVPMGPEREKRETEFIFEPSPARIIETLLPLFAQSTVYRMIAENVTSEQAARRAAMKLATDNAEEMITHLTRRFNRERQSQITKELTEIVGGSAAIA